MSSEEYKIVLENARKDAGEIVQSIKNTISMYENGQIEVGFLSGGIKSYSDQLDMICARVQVAGDIYYNRT